MTKTYEGIVIRQTKIMGGRRMVLIFTRGDGKISAGTRISESSKGGGALAIRPFAYGQYTINEKNAGTRTITQAETLDAHFALGENADRFAQASFALEFTDKVLPEEAPAPAIFDLLREYMGMLAARKHGFRLLTIAYMIKLEQEFGVFPEGGSGALGELLSGVNDDILNVIAYIAAQPLIRMDTLSLESKKEDAVFGVVRRFAAEYLDVGPMKSERMFAGWGIQN